VFRAVHVFLQVSELYAALLRWDQVATALPAVIRRLRSLAALHDESATALRRLATLEQLVTQTAHTAANDAQLLAQVGEFILPLFC
jgi:hypothetical protein